MRGMLARLQLDVYEVLKQKNNFFPKNLPLFSAVHVCLVACNYLQLSAVHIGITLLHHSNEHILVAPHETSRYFYYILELSVRSVELYRVEVSWGQWVDAKA
ncbi:hypothetical protein PYW08_015121 [Mythimna loreyi]|uniref:Uncharacterized protein n=1 Tax=Mythimna loreyi TaxID=667449 RepID=A0ACC2QVA8_9NEOP|nr:hypothetical protein PYW08_015121 [Mythimna loreyi]